MGSERAGGALPPPPPPAPPPLPPVPPPPEAFPATAGPDRSLVCTFFNP